MAFTPRWTKVPGSDKHEEIGTSDTGETMYRSTWDEIYDDLMVKRRRTITAVETKAERHECYFCSCDEDSMSDPACRNHGFAAKRPCDIHNLPGTEWDDYDPNADGSPDPSAGRMPMPVKEYREARKNGLAVY